MHQLFHKTPKSSYQLNQFLSQIITTNHPLTLPSFQTLIHLSLSLSPSPPHHLLPLLLTQFQPVLSPHLLTSLIQSLTNSHHHLPSILLFTLLPKFSLLPLPSTFPPLLKSISHLHLPPLGKSTHSLLFKLNLSSHLFSATALLSMYSAFSLVDDARRVFDEMPERNSVSWNAMITGLVHNRRFREAHQLFNDMLRSDARPGEVTVVGALTACAHLGALNQGVWIHNYIDRFDIRVNVFVGTALIDMYMKCGAVDEAVRVFRAMRFRNVFSWNALISGFGMNGRGELAMEAFDAMIRERVKPDRVTFLAMLCACCHQGLVEDGRRVFITMEREFGFKPKVEHYGCMMDLLGRAGLLEEAHELIRTMPVEPDAIIWRTLLASCRIHGHAQLGELAIKKLLELEPNNGENYVLLSNVLAREHRWTEVGEVREVMRNRGIAKVPGCSSIEIDNVIYEFVVTSRFAKGELEEIFAMLGDMKRELRLAGYVAETEMVSYDLEDEEKEDSLLYHSEKLALAFGLLRTRRGAVIRIVKNLRVCKDCHLFFKLVSKAYEREIVVRDRNRFHHFSGGLCSCKDYW